jgi:formylglycine-generating enzyme required for sulfatase activity
LFPTHPRTRRASGGPAAPSAVRRLLTGAALATLALLPGVVSAQSSAPAPLYGQSWALVVGIDKYDKVRPRLNYAVADAREVAATLPALGFPKENTRVLLDAQATKANIEQVLYREFAGMGPNDRLFVYFAGHGETSDIKGGEEGYLLPVEADPKALPPTSISMDEVKRIGQRVRAKHVFFAIDACFSGFALTRDTLPKRGGDEYLAAVARLPTVQVITAGRKGEQAIEANGHGLFTRRLLDAFRGQADLEGHGYLTAAQLFSWVEQRVGRDSQGKMTPQYGKLDGEGQFIFTMPRIGGPPVVAVAPAPTVRMEPRTDVGSLYVTATLPGIEVWLGEQRLGETTTGQTLIVDNLGAGRHHLRATKSGYQEWRSEVSITPKGRTDAMIQLQPAAAGARPASEPPRVAALPPPAPVPSGALARALGGDRAPMVFVAAGAFLMGASDDDARATPAEKPQRTVTLSAYWIDQYEVTNAQWSVFRQAHGGGAATALTRDPRFAGARRPIVGATWDQAQEYCRWAGKRLPTEAEWEKAARGTDGRAYPWGEAAASSPPAQVGKTETSDVGSHPRGASVYGALDMAGNVWEWVLDWYDPSAYKRVATPANPKGPTIGGEKVLRGGSWWERDPASARTTSRHHQAPDRAHNNVGFRCVVSGDDQLR